MEKVVTGGYPANSLQKNFFRAGHAHAAAMPILGIVIQIPLSQVETYGPIDWIAAAAILMPAGFFLSVLGEGPAKPGRLFALLWAVRSFPRLGSCAPGC